MITILLVIEDPTAFLALKDNFELDGYRVIRSRESQPELDAAFAQRPVLAIVDVLDTDRGLSICRRIRGMAAGLPIIALSAEALFRSDFASALDAGADVCMAKPFAIQDLLSRARTLVCRCRTYERNDYKPHVCVDVSGP